MARSSIAWSHPRSPAAPRAAALQLTVALCLLPCILRAQESPPLPTPLEHALAGLTFREIGPAVMGGRVADIAAVESDPSTFYVGFATGGVWKTTSQGMSWTPVFDHESTGSIGDVTVAPSNPNIVWIGTGEPQNRQSSPWGDGVYRSTDAGRTWQAMGLRETRHIARIVIHPRNPDIVYAAAVGHLFGPNPERGVFRTKDGGATWTKVLYIDENTGAIDLAMDPADPNTLFAAMYQRRRTAWGFSAAGQGSGLYRTTDGGEHWTELTNGLPAGDKGRIGIDIYRRDGNLVHALVESDDHGRGLYRSTDRGETWERISTRDPRPMYFSQVRIDPNDPERIYLGGVEFSISDDGGKTWHEGDAAPNIHVDHHAIWIDPNDSDHLLLGNDGGISSSFDRGRTWRHHNNLAVGQFYSIGVDMRDPYWVCGGLQDNSSWCGPSESLTSYGIRNSDWYDVSGGDGFYNRIDPTDPTIVYTESQGGNMSRYDTRTGESTRIKPVSRAAAEDSTQEFRWNWSTPIEISSHDPETIYVGANRLLRSRDRGMTWETVSPDLTRAIDRDTLRIMGALVTDSTPSGNDGVSSFPTITVIGESPLDANVIYIGTDDGKLSVTRDGGATWTDVSENVSGIGRSSGDDDGSDLGLGMVVSGIEPSHHVAGRVYLTLDGHYSDDYRPFVYVSEDYGQSWKPIIGGLPDWSVNVIREHPRTPGLLFLGNEIGAYVSVDRGASWHRLGQVSPDSMAANGTTAEDEVPTMPGGALPTVPVDDIVLHPRENDLVLGTHGRSIWIMDDVRPLETLASGDDILANAARLFPIQPASFHSHAGGWPFHGDEYAAPNPPDGALIRYWLAHDVRADSAAAVAAGDSDGRGDDAAPAAPRPSKPDSAGVTLAVLDAAGDTVRELNGDAHAGLHTLVWDLRSDPPYEPESREQGQGGGRFGGPPQGPPVLPGTYTVQLEAGGTTMTQDVSVSGDPRIQVADADLHARHAALLSLNALQKPAHEANLALTEAGKRIEAMRSLLSGDAAEVKTLKQEADSLGKQLDALRQQLGRASRDARAAGAIEGVTAAPTADQLWQIDQAWSTVPEAIRAINTFTAGPLESLSAKVYQEAARPEPITAVTLPERPR